MMSHSLSKNDGGGARVTLDVFEAVAIQVAQVSLVCTASSASQKRP